MWKKTGMFRLESDELEMTFQLEEAHMEEDTQYLCDLLNEAWKLGQLKKVLLELDNGKECG